MPPARLKRLRDAGAYDALFVSPHLDDAALSCAGRIGASGRVLVVTLFTSGDGYEARIAEDDAAMRLLGADALHLGLRDAPWRSQAYREARGILLGWDPGDDDTMQRVVDALRQLRERTGAALIGPLGVGEHVDHRIAHAASREVGARTFYEDRPYALAEGAVASRLFALGLGPRPDPLAWGRGLASARYAQKWIALGTRARLVARAAMPRKRGAAALPEVTAYGSTGLERAVAAAGAYRTQIPWLHGDLRTLEADYRAYAAGLGAEGHAERLWRLP